MESIGSLYGREIPSISQSIFLISGPQEKPPNPPFATTLWQGIRIRIGFFPHALPTARLYDEDPPPIDAAISLYERTSP